MFWPAIRNGWSKLLKIPAYEALSVSFEKTWPAPGWTIHGKKKGWQPHFSSGLSDSSHTTKKNSLSSLRQGEVCPNRQKNGHSGHDNHLRLYSKSKKSNRMLKKWEQDHIHQLLFFFMRQHCPHNMILAMPYRL